MHGRALDEWMRERAGAQHGLVGRDELRAVGASRTAVAYRIGSPDWEALSERVLRLVGAPVTAHQPAMAGVLDAGGGAIVSHASAAALWGLPGFAVEPVHVSRDRRRRRPARLATAHLPRLLLPHHATERYGIPVTTLARTIVDLGATEHPSRVELALHAAVRSGLRWSDVERAVSELSAQGRAGVPLARSLVERDSGRPPLGSGLEGRLLRILRAAGLPEPRRQVDLGAGEWVGRVDFLYDDVRLVIEVDGGWHHEHALAVRRDKRRAAALAAAGFRVLPLPESFIRSDPDTVVRLVAEARRRPTARTGA